LSACGERSPAVGLDVAALVERDRYAVSDVEIATALPDFWLGGREEPTLAGHLRAVVGGATARADLRPEAFGGHADQRFFVFLVETSDTAHARGLLRLSEKHAGTRELLGVASGRLFGLVVGGSSVVGKPAFESSVSLRRFAEGLQATLDAHSGSGR
jgi:hypothetical protein